jgi:hypothetical protein
VDGEYDLNIGRFIEDHRDYVIRAGPGGFGYQVQLRDDSGKGVGERWSALTLDELAAQLEAAESLSPVQIPGGG